MKKLGFALLIVLSVLVGCGNGKRTTAPKTTPTPTTTQFNGVDVSHHQGNINWAKVAKENPNIEYVYIKATEGTDWTDKKFEKNRREARQNGFKVGAYHFFRNSDAKLQFEHFKKIAPKDSIDLIPMVDVEDCNGASVTQVQSNLKNFLELCKEYYGKQPIIYGTQRSYNTYCTGTFKDYQKMIGRYGNNKPELKDKSAYTIWQFSDKSYIKGHSGKTVDISRYGKGCSIKDLLLR